MKVVSPILKRLVYPSLAKSGFFRRSSAGGLAVVTYHGVLPEGYVSIDPQLDGNLISRDTLRRQLRLLKANYTVIAPADLLAWCDGHVELAPRSVLLTCDDGLLNHLTDMLPVLREEGLQCLFFVTGRSTREKPAMLWYEDLFLMFLRAPSGRFGVRSGGVEIGGELSSPAQRKALWWNVVKRLSQIEGKGRHEFLAALRNHFGLKPSLESEDTAEPFARRFRVLNAAEIHELAAAGMTIGAHTMTHPILAELPRDLALAEMAESRGSLEAVLGQIIWALAYAFGNAESVTPDIFSMAQQCGYKTAFVNFGGGLGAELPRYAMPRVHVTSEMGLSEFEACIAGFYASLQRRAGRTAATPQMAKG